MNRPLLVPLDAAAGGRFCASLPGFTLTATV
jgi:hypothetical protein